MIGARARSATVRIRRARRKADDRRPAQLTEDDMQTRRTWQAGLEVSALGLGAWLCPDRGPAGADRPDPGRRRAWRHLLRHRRILWSVHNNEEIVGEALARSGPGGDRHQFGHDIDLETGRRLGGLKQPPRPHQAAVDGMLRRLRTDRSTCCTSTGSTPTCRGGRRRGGEGSDPAGKAGISACRKPRAVDPPGARRQPSTALPERVLAVDAGAGGRRIPVIEQLGIGLVPYSPLGKGS